MQLDLCIVLRYYTVWEDILRVCVAIDLSKCCEHLGVTQHL